MSGRYRFKKASQELHRIKQDEVSLFPGELGLKLGGETLVEVADRPGYVYVRLSTRQSEVIKAFNETVSLVYGLPVLVGIDKHIKTRYYVAGRDTGRYVNWGSSTPYLPLHGASHSFDVTYPGADIVWVWERQFMPMLGAPSGSSAAMSLVIEPHTLYLRDAWTYVGGTGTPSFTAYKPTGSSARMVLVYMDADGNPALSAGADYFAATITGSAQVYPYIPSLPVGAAAAVGAVRLVSGTSTLGWDNLYDLRQFFVTNATGSYAAYANVDHTHTMQAIYYADGALSVSDDPMKIPNHTGRTLTIAGVYLDAAGGPSGSSVIVDIHKNGTTIFTNPGNRPQIAHGTLAGNTTTVDVPSWADGQYLTMHIDQIGSGTAGSDLTVTVKYS